MPDYEKMYFKMFNAAEDAINQLIAVQRECEEMYMAEPEQQNKLILFPKKEGDCTDGE